MAHEKCINHQQRTAVASVSDDRGRLIAVCISCKDRILGTEFHCKHCKVKMVSRTDHRAAILDKHASWCPRAHLDH